MRYKKLPIYLKFPILQIIYTLLCSSLGVIIAYYCSIFIIAGTSIILLKILNKLLPLSLQMYILSGRMDLILMPFYAYILITFYLLFLIIGLEFINHLCAKKRSTFNE